MIKKLLFGFCLPGAVLFVTLVLGSCNLGIGNPPEIEPEEPEVLDVMTPYLEDRSTDEYFAGVTFDLSATGRNSYAITRELERMRTLNINTITVYGLENESRSIRDHLFSELARLGMKIVVRIESYDASTFAFTESDAHRVLDSYTSLLDYVSADSRKDTVAYFAVNMPVDDTRVQDNAGGLNSEQWINAQVSYAKTIITLLRNHTSDLGFDDAKFYLSVHYGWDNTFDIPSYRDSGADGYFINCYSYPYLHGGDDGRGDTKPSADDPVDQLIDKHQIDTCMNKYKSQYQLEDGSYAPVVMEFGFHTMEYNNWKKTDQTAGLVWDREAKKVAMQESVKYYDEQYPFVRGVMYFGYNLLKTEGADNAMMDWTLVYTK